jgi:hypothetical protein
MMDGATQLRRMLFPAIGDGWFNNVITGDVVDNLSTVSGNRYHILQSHTTNPELAFPTFNRKHHAWFKNLGMLQ